MKKPSTLKKDLPVVVSSIMAALSMGFMVSAVSTSEYEHANQVAPFIFAGVVFVWVLFLFVYPAMVDTSGEDELIE